MMIFSFLQNMEKIRGTFLEFIIRNGFQALVPLFQASTTFQGYGHIDEVAALYGLMWNTPNFINGFKERLAGKGFGGKPTGLTFHSMESLSLCRSITNFLQGFITTLFCEGYLGE